MPDKRVPETPGDTGHVETGYVEAGYVETAASVGQRLLWMMRHYRSERGALSCPVLCRIRGPLDLSRLTEALNELVSRHEALRTTFTGRGPRLVQRIHTAMPITVRHEDLSTARQPEEEVRQAVREELAEPVDVSTCSVRAVLWRLASDDHVLCFNQHHLVTDAWSSGVAFAELCALYEGAQLPPVQQQYPQFVEWQREALEGSRLRRQREYWKRQLDGAALPELPEVPEPPGIEAEPAHGGSVAFAKGHLSGAVARRLAELAAEERTTSFAVLLAVFYGQLRRITGQTDLLVASMFANRLRPENRSTVGFLANMVLLRTVVRRSGSFRDLLRDTHRTVVGATINQELPYQVLPVRVPENDGVRADDLVFQVMPEFSHRSSRNGAEFELLVPDDIGNRFRVEFTMTPISDGYRIVLFYSTDTFGEQTARGLVSGFERSAAAVAAAPGTPLAEMGV